jgi:Zn finger protein HypA/HybF involved in hydrogenase expression
MPGERTTTFIAHAATASNRYRNRDAMLSLQPADFRACAGVQCGMQRFPFRTFDEIAALGLEVHVYCPSCHRQTGPIDLGHDRLRGRAFSATRFVCSNNRTYGTAHPPRACGCLGYVMIKPGARDLIPPGRSIPWCSIECPRCVPYWEVSQAARHLPPWNRIWTRPGVRVACPACGSPLTTVWHGADGVPFTPGFRRGNERGSDDVVRP